MSPALSVVRHYCVRFTRDCEFQDFIKKKEAPDMATACELAKQTIQLAGGGKTEVRAFADFGK